MIPYEDLVIALQTWRAKQGLPIGQFSGQLTPPPPTPSAPPAAAPKAAPAPAAVTAPAPAPYDMPDDHLDVEDGALIEESHYDNEGGDFAMSFGNANEESTTIGNVPRPSESTIDEDDGSGSGRNRW
jgi:hypothetical protein